MPRQTATYVIKGINYYDAAKALSAGALKRGSAITLKRDPANPYDSHAVEVWLESPSYRLGYIPKTASQRVSSLILSSDFERASVQSVSKKSNKIKVFITIWYERREIVIPKSTTPRSRPESSISSVSVSPIPYPPQQISTPTLKAPEPIQTRQTQDNGLCFVATAAYGGEDHPDVQFLRRFRDNYLINFSIGRAFVRWYKAYGSKLASFTLRSSVRQAIVRFLLTRIVWVFRFFFNPRGGLY